MRLLSSVSLQGALLLMTTLAEPTIAASYPALRGTVTLAGESPPQLPLKRGTDPACRGGAALNQEVLVDQGKLQNVAVWLEQVGQSPAQDTLGKKEASMPPPLTVVQRQCDYLPRVQVGRLGQMLQLINSDNTLHNIHGYRESRTLFNRAQPPRANPIQQGPLRDVGITKLRCDVHPWMTGYVLVPPTPFASKFSAVSNYRGEFSIEAPPPGAYTLHAWHEKFGQKKMPIQWPITESHETSIQFNTADR